MSQTIAPAPAPYQPAVSSWFSGTPGRLRALLLLAVAFAVVFGVCVAQAFREADGSLTRAEANTAQLVRIQSIHTSLVSANADATNAFLRGGLEPPAQRQHFTDSLSTASKLIAEAAKAQPADAEALGALNATLLTYQGLVEQARANNRQGLPVGAQYLKDANAAAGLVVLLTTAVGGGMLSNAADDTDDVRDSSYAGTLALARARIAAYDAKSNESLTLIARGSGAAFEKAWTTSAGTAKQELVGAELHGTGSAGLGQRWGEYEVAHRRVRELDDSGKWEDAVKQALGDNNTSFSKFDEASRQSLEQTSTAARSGLLDAGGALPLMGWLGIPIGLVVALLAWWGLSQRLEEYR